VGKTAVAHVLAHRLGLPILSADSMLVYRGMDIGTAKPSLEDRKGIAYFGIDLVGPEQDFSVADYLAAVRASNPPPQVIVAGGTGLYAKCLLQGLDEVAPPDEALRQRLASLPVEELQAELRRVDPEGFDRLRDKQNPRRLVRALEKAHGGRTAGLGWSDPAGTIVGLRMDPSRLANRIEARVEAMYAGGLLDEAARLRAAGGLSKTARQAIGYAEAWDVLDGKASVPVAMERTAARTRQLAKRQMTWFRNQAHVDWIEVGPGADAQALADMVHSRWQQHGPNDVRI
jgi:tRNA dimethylallyltransferase